MPTWDGASRRRWAVDEGKLTPDPSRRFPPKLFQSWEQFGRTLKLIKMREKGGQVDRATIAGRRPATALGEGFGASSEES